MERAYAVWRAFQDRFLTHAAALILLACTLLALLEVVRRYVFGVSYEWQQDAVTFFIVSAVFLYFGISQRHNEHLNVVLLLEVLQAAGPRARQAAEIIKLVALVLSLIFMIAVVWWGIPEVEDAMKYASRTESLAFPMAPFLWALIVGFAFMGITMVFQIYFEIQKLRGREVPEEAPILDRMPD
ncbi:MAG TPA: TRAP transporter small permease [Burkholderiales bacterium]|nr:TRAP transporter small permease [Burkholderiales bacterium]